MLRDLRGNPNSRLAKDEHLDPAHVAWLIQRPRDAAAAADTTHPKWLVLLRSLLSGIYHRQHGFCVAQRLYVGLQSTLV